MNTTIKREYLQKKEKEICITNPQEMKRRKRTQSSNPGKISLKLLKNPFHYK